MQKKKKKMWVKFCGANHSSLPSSAPSTLNSQHPVLTQQHIQEVHLTECFCARRIKTSTALADTHTGIKLPPNKIIDIMCDPQTRRISYHVIDFIIFFNLVPRRTL